MKSNPIWLSALAGVALGALGSSAFAATEIHWWHAMGGALGDRVNEITENFNKSQSDYTLVSSYKGSYPETMTAGIAAFRAGKQPHIMQVFEVGTATMMGAEGAIVPVYQLMEEAGVDFDSGAYIPAVAGYYTTTDGKMLSLPFNSSTPVLFYNKDAFKKAGLDPDNPPKTWPEVAEAAKTLIDAGYECGFSTAWQSWIHLENFSAWHNAPLGTKENGFGGVDTEFTFNGPLQVKHIQQLADWQKDKIFVYGGRRNLGNAKFTSGECPLYTESSAGYGGFKSAAEFEFGTSELPYWPDVEGAPQNTIIGGASLWVLAGHESEEYKGVAAFFPISVFARAAGLVAPEYRLCADYHRRLRNAERAGFLRGKSGPRYSHRAVEQQAADGKLQGSAFRQFCPGARYCLRGTGSDLGRPEDRARGLGRGGRTRQRRVA